MYFSLKSLSLVLFLTISTIISLAQNTYPQDYFSSPINGRIYLSGTFGELRGNHFHTGLDIKTVGVEGKNIYAAADGYISRIKVSPWGYGHALYIKHPNGYTTVYGHLKNYNDTISNYVKAEQYKQQKFAMDLFPEPHQIKIQKGEIIGLSGNSGSSGGPHLHFEIRDSKTEEPLNPLLFGIHVKDFITPTIKSLRIYPAEKGALVQGKSKAENFILKGWGKDYAFKNGDSIIVHGDFYTGISTIDKLNDSHNKNGVYSISIYVDSLLFYHHHLERLNFSTNRYINTLIDYEYYKKKKRKYQRSYISPNNDLELYDSIKNKGVFSYNDNQYHLIKYVVKDFKENESVLHFTILSKPVETSYDTITSDILNPLTKNTFKDEHIEIYFPPNCLYDTMTFASVAQSSHKGSITPIYQIGNKEVALQKSIQVKLNYIPNSPNEKKYIGCVSNNHISYTSSKQIDDQLIFKTRNFGSYGIFTDSIPPTISLKTKKDRLKSSKIISFYVNEKESGISDYNAWLNGKWVILEWDPKKNKMFIKNDLVFQDSNILQIEVTDLLLNKEILKIEF